MNKITISALSVYACHGVNETEKSIEQPFILSCDMYLDFYDAALQDDLSKTVNYADVCAMLESTIIQNSYNLIETLAYRCAFSITDKYPGISRIALKISKPQAPVTCKVEDVSVSLDLKKETAYLSLGSSMGDKKAYLDFALERLSKIPGIKVEKISSYLATEPYGGVAKNKFLNACVKVSTFLSPFSLLDRIHEIEAEAKRRRDVRWGDRTLDIDIVLFGKKKIDTEELTIPHPDCKNRDFVLIPLKEIAPELFRGGDAYF